jgi:predicted metalloprotease with PDZ domain
MINVRYGNFNTDRFTVHFAPIGGGLEGLFSFAQLDCSSPYFYYVLSHEALHQFVGIRCGEYDDPWWKEGATSYLSYLVAVRLKLFPKEDFRKYISKKFAFADSSSFNVALSDPWLRTNMFPSGKWEIVYTKGAQVMMLLDYKTRIASNNSYSVEDVMSYLVKQFDGSAFHRKDMLDAFTKFGNPDVRDIFSTYIDIAGEHPSDSLLAFTYAKLDSLGAFGGAGIVASSK